MVLCIVHSNEDTGAEDLQDFVSTVCIAPNSFKIVFRIWCEINLQMYLHHCQ